MRSAEANGHLRRIEDVLSRAHTKAFRGGEKCTHTGDPVEYRTPLDEIMEAEERAEAMAAVESLEVAQMMLQMDKLPEPLSAKVRAFAFDAYRQNEEMWLEWLFEEGPNPLIVMKRLFAYVKMKRADLLWNMAFRDLGALFGESHAAMAIRCKVLFGETPAGWKKPMEARLKMKASALKNNNRRGGKRASAHSPTLKIGKD